MGCLTVASCSSRVSCYLALVASLQKQGLILSAKANAETLKQYQELGKKARRDLVGKLYSAQLLDKVEKSLEELRSVKTKKS